MVKRVLSPSPPPFDPARELSSLSETLHADYEAMCMAWLRPDSKDGQKWHLTLLDPSKRGVKQGA